MGSVAYRSECAEQPSLNMCSALLFPRKLKCESQLLLLVRWAFGVRLRLCAAEATDDQNGQDQVCWREHTKMSWRTVLCQQLNWMNSYEMSTGWLNVHCAFYNALVEFCAGLRDGARMRATLPQSASAGTITTYSYKTITIMLILIRRAGTSDDYTRWWCCNGRYTYNNNNIDNNNGTNNNERLLLFLCSLFGAAIWSKKRKCHAEFGKNHLPPKVVYWSQTQCKINRR